jgi:hypothetical protein
MQPDDGSLQNTRREALTLVGTVQVVIS